MADLATNLGITNMWSAASTINFITTTSLMMGVVFQLPLIMFFLNKTRLVDYHIFSNYRKHVLVLLVMGIAFISPQVDAASLILTSLPVWLMYEAGVMSCRIF
jgi:sec-independent protein translocase protein TatC